MASSRRSAKNADPASGVDDRDPVVDAVLRSLDAARAASALACPVSSHRPVLVAFSGGLDSTVLLDAAVCALGADAVVALHVHHGLQPAADHWPAHCAGVVQALGVRFECARLGRAPVRGANLEAWAREARYAALVETAQRLGAAALMTAHHADDQAETLLMRIARGTGVDGMAGVRRALARDGMPLLRPLRDLPRAELARRAHARALCWVEDPTNRDTARLRNAIRHRALPALDAVAPRFREHLLRLADDLDAARAAVDALAAIDLEAARPADAPQALDAGVLASLSPARRRAALRRWLGELGLPAPGEAALAEVERQLVLAGGAYGCVRHAGWTLRRYRTRVLAQAPAGPAAPAASGDDPGATLLRWRGEPELALPGFGGRLRFDDAGGGGEGADRDPDADPAVVAIAHADGPGVSADWLRDQTLRVTVPASSARLRPHPRARARTLKNLYQERGVPAWQRPTLPLVWAGARLLFAAGLGMDCAPGWPAEGRRVRLEWVPDPVPPEPAAGDSRQRV